MAVLFGWLCAILSGLLVAFAVVDFHAGDQWHALVSCGLCASSFYWSVYWLIRDCLAGKT